MGLASSGTSAMARATVERRCVSVFTLVMPIWRQRRRERGASSCWRRWLMKRHRGEGWSRRPLTNDGRFVERPRKMTTPALAWPKVRPQRVPDRESVLKQVLTCGFDRFVAAFCGRGDVPAFSHRANTVLPRVLVEGSFTGTVREVVGCGYARHTQKKFLPWVRIEP